MGTGFSPLRLFFALLIKVCICEMIGAMALPATILPNALDVANLVMHHPMMNEGDDSHDVRDHHHHARQIQVPHDLGQMDPSHYVFLTEKDLKVGKTMPIYFPNTNPTASHFLSKEEADSIPFSSSELPYLLQFFSIPSGSPSARAMEYTLRHCELKPVKGETKICATSLESMLDFIKGVFGTPFSVLTTKYHRKEGTINSVVALQNYTILQVLREEESANEMVACHSMAYPYAVFYCHHLDGESKVFKVTVVGEINGGIIEAIVVCHMDTSAWNLDHVAFHMLGIKRGTEPVCHFFPDDNLVWVPSLPAATSI